MLFEYPRLWNSPGAGLGAAAVAAEAAIVKGTSIQGRPALQLLPVKDSMRSSDLTHQRRAEIIYAEFTAAQSQLQNNTINRINYQGGESSARLVVDVAEGAVFTSTDTNLFTVPTAPTGVNLVFLDASGNGDLTTYTLSWNAPTSIGGTPITYYTITSNYGVVIQSTTTSAEIAVPYHIDNTFTVTATNIKGTSLSSSTTPSAPTGVTAVAASLSAVISWTPPVSNGGALLTGYSMVSTPFGSQTTLPTNTTATFTGLTVRPYTFAVFATNYAAKNSALSAQSATVTPLA